MNTLPNEWTRPGRWLVSLVGLLTALGCWLADYSSTHMFNDHWPPHAKFHNAQTILLGTLLGLLTVFYAWRRRGVGPDNLMAAILLSSLYWITQATAGLLPNTGLTDPEFLGPTRLPFGLTGPQPFLDAAMLSLIAIAYALERRWLARHLAA